MKAEYATLLSEAEYEKYQSNIPRIKCWWWLRTSRQFDVDDGGEIIKYRYPDRVNMLGFVDHNPIATQNYVAGLRPAIKIYEHEYTIGNIISYGGNTWTYIGENYLLSDYIISFSEYDSRKNIQWEDSELKNKLQTFAKHRKWIT